MKRTMYEAARHTPKRGVGGSNPLMDASKQRCKPLFIRVCSFFVKPQTFVETIYQGWRVTFLFMRYKEFLANWKRTKMERLLRKIAFLLI